MITISTSGATAWTNAGALTETNSTLNLGGTFTQAGLGGFFTRSGGTINLTGTLTGGLTLDATTGSWVFRGGTMQGGAFTASGGAALIASQFSSTLDGVTLDSAIDLSSIDGAVVVVKNNLTFAPGVIQQVGNTAGTTHGVINLQGNETIGVAGNSGPTDSSVSATIILGPNAGNLVNPNTNNQVTIDAGITILGGYGSIGSSGGTIFNYGTIDTTTPNNVPTSDLITVNLGIGGVNEVGGLIEAINPMLATPTSQVGLRVDGMGGSNGSAWTNQGTITVTGGTLEIGFENRTAETWSNTGTISSTSSTVILSGTFTQAGLGNFSRDAASTVNLDGTLNGGLTLNDTLGAWNLTASGVINGGTYSVANGSAASTKLIANQGTLTNVTLNSAIDLTTNSAARVFINGDLTLNTTLAVGDPNNASKSGTIFFKNAGAHNLNGTGAIVFGASASNQIDSNNNGDVLNIGSGITIRGQNGELHMPGSLASGTALVNNGTIQADVSGGTITVDPTGAFTNNGTVIAKNSGTLVIHPGNLTNVAAGTLTGGSWQVFNGGSLDLTTAAAVTTDAADLIIDGSGSSIFTGAAGNTNLQTSLTSIASAGTPAVQSGAHYSTAGAFSDAGTLSIGPAGSTFTLGASAAYTQTAGETAVNGTLASSSGASLQAGLLFGDGTIQGNVLNAANINPGDVNLAGSLTVTGNYVQTSTGTLTTEIGGATAGTFDQLHVGGATSLQGTLNIAEINGFTAATPQSFQIMTFGSKSGDFTTYNGLQPASGASFSPSFSSTALTLNAVTTTFTVSNTNDSGAGSLRQAIIDANAHSGGGTIAFNIAGSGVQDDRTAVGAADDH